MRLSQEILDVLLVLRHMYCIERDSGARDRGEDRLDQKDNGNNLLSAGNHLKVGRSRQHPAQSDDTESQKNGIELYVQIPTHPYRHAQIFVPAFKDPFLRRLTHEPP